MATQKPKQIPATDRSMAPTRDATQVFFFPKRNPPVSIRATSREEAERQLAAEEATLEAPNTEEND